MAGVDILEDFNGLCWNEKKNDFQTIYVIIQKSTKMDTHQHLPPNFHITIL